MLISCPAKIGLPLQTETQPRKVTDLGPNLSRAGCQGRNSETGLKIVVSNLGFSIEMWKTGFALCCVLIVLRVLHS